MFNPYLLMDWGIKSPCSQATILCSTRGAWGMAIAPGPETPLLSFVSSLISSVVWNWILILLLFQRIIMPALDGYPWSASVAGLPQGHLLILAGWNELLIASFSHRSVSVQDGILLATGLHVHRSSAHSAGVGSIFDRCVSSASSMCVCTCVHVCV